MFGTRDDVRRLRSPSTGPQPGDRLRHRPAGPRDRPRPRPAKQILGAAAVSHNRQPGGNSTFSSRLHCCRDRRQASCRSPPTTRRRQRARLQGRIPSRHCCRLRLGGKRRADPYKVAVPAGSAATLCGWLPRRTGIVRHRGAHRAGPRAPDPDAPWSASAHCSRPFSGEGVVDGASELAVLGESGGMAEQP